MKYQLGPQKTNVTRFIFIKKLFTNFSHYSAQWLKTVYSRASHKGLVATSIYGQFLDLQVLPLYTFYIKEPPSNGHST